MATVTQIAAGAWVADAATVWSTGAVPAIGDDAVATANFDLQLDDDSTALGSFDRTGSTGTLTLDNAKTLDVDGACDLDGPIEGPGTIAVSGALTMAADTVFSLAPNLLLDGTGNLTDNSTAPGGANIEVNTAGTATLAADAYCVDFTRTLGEIDTATFELIASGAVTHVGGTGTPNITMLNVAQKALAWEAATHEVYLTIPLGSSVQLTGTTNWFRLSGAGDIDLNGNDFFSGLLADDFWPFTGNMTGAGSVKITWTAPRSNATPICCGAADVIINGLSADTVLTTPVLETTGTLGIRNNTTGRTAFLSITSRLLAGATTIGWPADIDRSGGLIVGGMASMASLTAGHPTGNLANTFAFGGGSHVEFSGLGDFDNIAPTASTDMPPEIVCGAGGKVTNCEPDNEIALFGDANVNDTPGTNNLNITNFVNNQKYPDGLTGVIGGRLIVPFWLMGMGIYSLMTMGMC